MFKKLGILFLVVFVLSLVVVNPLGAEEQKIVKKFKKKSAVKILTVSGDCIVKKGKKNEITVLLIHTYSPKNFKPEFLDKGGTLVLKEKFFGSSQGQSEWRVTVPEKTKIGFKSASGDFSVSGLSEMVSAKTASGDIKGEDIRGNFKVDTASGDIDIEDILGNVDLDTASGDIEAKRISGEISFNTASGDIEIDGAKGELKIVTASGDIEAKKLEGDKIVAMAASGDIELFDVKGAIKVKTASGEVDVKSVEIRGESYFGTASGEVEVQLSKSAQYNITLSSASGDVVLNYNGNQVFGYFEFIARKDRGDIVSPFKFDNEEEFSKHGQKYMRKTFKRKKEVPKILLKTASGKAELKK